MSHHECTTSEKSCSRCWLDFDASSNRKTLTEIPHNASHTATAGKLSLLPIRPSLDQSHDLQSCSWSFKRVGSQRRLYKFAYAQIVTVFTLARWSIAATAKKKSKSTKELMPGKLLIRLDGEPSAARVWACSRRQCQQWMAAVVTATWQMGKSTRPWLPISRRWFCTGLRSS